MAIKEQDKVFYEELANGDKVINLPITRANNVEGLGRSANTTYVVGDVVYVDNNKKVALKCTQAGTTSNTELSISGRAVGESVEDGSVVWKVIERSNVLDEGGVVPIANGGTGGNTFVKSASISGRDITLNMSDGTKKTLTTQDTQPVFPAPNYTSVVKLSLETTHTMSNDGFLHVRARSTQPGQAIYVDVRINGANLYDVWANSYSADSLFYPVRKNDTVKLTVTNSSYGEVIAEFFKAR